MRSFWSDPYLWVHLAGLATLPIWLELCLLGLAVGDPLLPTWLELFLVGAVGVAPTLWMQWQCPFSIFSLVLLALKPEQLTEDQRKLLTLFKSSRNRVLAVGAAIVLLLVLQKLYTIAPIAASIAPFSPNARLLGLGVAAIAFLGANLFLQVPLAVLSVLLTRESTFAATLPYASDQIRQSFTLLGLPVGQILPPVVAAAKFQVETVPPVADPLNTTPTAPESEDLTDPWAASAESTGEPEQQANLETIGGDTVTTEEVWIEAEDGSISPSEPPLQDMTDADAQPPNSL